MKNIPLRGGITLIEVLASVLVICIGLIGVLAVLPYGAFQVAQAQHTEYAANMLANAAEEVVLRRMTHPGTWGAASMLTSGGCPAALQTQLDHWLKNPGTKIPDGAEEHLVFARRWNGSIVNCDKIIWVEPVNADDPPKHIFRIGSTFPNIEYWKELLRGEDDLAYLRSDDGERPNFASVKSTGKYRWFFTFKPQKTFASPPSRNAIVSIDPTSLHFGVLSALSTTRHLIENTPFYKEVQDIEEVDNPNHDAAQPDDPVTNPKKIWQWKMKLRDPTQPESPTNPKEPVMIRIRCNMEGVHPTPSDPTPTMTPCPPYQTCVYDSAGNLLYLRLRIAQLTDALREAKSLLINQEWYAISSIGTPYQFGCDTECQSQEFQVFNVQVVPWQGAVPPVGQNGITAAEANYWYLPKPFAALTDADVDVLACWNRVSEDDVHVSGCTFQPGYFQLPATDRAENLEKLTQTKYVFVTWDAGGEASGVWCRIVFVDRDAANVYVTGLPSSLPSTAQVTIASGVLFHKKVRYEGF